MTSILEKTTGLVAFVRTVDAGSFSAASRLIGSSQSAVSKSVARLERRLGVRLIQRSTRTLSVTAEGQAYYEPAGIMVPIVTASHVDPNLMVLSTGAGSLMCSHVNDAGFWLFKEYFNLDLRTPCVPGLSWKAWPAASVYCACWA
jgi:hypothetical protein